MGNNPSTSAESTTVPTDGAVSSGDRRPLTTVDRVRECIQSAAALNEVDEDGYTPLMRAAESGNLEIVKLLLDAGVDIEIRNRAGRDAVALAIHADAIDIVQAILEADEGVQNRARAAAEKQASASTATLLTKAGKTEITARVKSKSKLPQQQTADLVEPKINLYEDLHQPMPLRWPPRGKTLAHDYKSRARRLSLSITEATDGAVPTKRTRASAAASASAGPSSAASSQSDGVEAAGGKRSRTRTPSEKVGGGATAQAGVTGKTPTRDVLP